MFQLCRYVMERIYVIVCVCLWLAKYSYLWCLHQADRSKWHPGNVNIENPSQICDDNTRQLAQHVLLIHRKWYVDVGSVNAHNDMKTNVQRANAYLDWKLKAKRRFFFSLKNEKTEIEKNETEREREREWRWEKNLWQDQWKKWNLSLWFKRRYEMDRVREWERKVSGKKIKPSVVTVILGVGLRGESGPNAPIVLGTNIRKLYCLANSITLCTPSILTLECKQTHTCT